MHRAAAPCCHPEKENPTKDLDGAGWVLLQRPRYPDLRRGGEILRLAQLAQDDSAARCAGDTKVGPTAGRFPGRLKTSLAAR